MRFSKVDLNLFVAFDALMKERNLTKAGQLVGLSQPAMSHVLDKLRRLWGDPLFVRIGGAMEPTPFALRVAAFVSEGLSLLDCGVKLTSGFEPEKSDRHFRLLMSDAGAIVYLPRLISDLSESAPNVVIHALTPSRYDYQSILEGGIADLAIGVLPNLQGSGLIQKLVEGHGFACYLRDGHPRISGRLSPDDFLNEKHVAVEPGGSSPNPRVTQLSASTILDKRLDELGIRRRVAVYVPNYATVPSILRRTDLLAVLPTDLPEALGTAGLQVLPLPFDVPSFTSKMYWHRRNHDDPGNVWLRKKIDTLFGSGF